MDAYSRALVMFAHGALRSRRSVEAFCFGTRLTRVTHALAAADPRPYPGTPALLARLSRRRSPMDVEPIKSTRIYEEIVRQVKQLIAEGKLKSGDRLPPERDLAEKFMVSRTSVREALRALQSGTTTGKVVVQL